MANKQRIFSRYCIIAAVDFAQTPRRASQRPREATERNVGYLHLACAFVLSIATVNDIYLCFDS